jgi:hypothetical protein
MKRWNHFYISINKCRQVYFLSTSASPLQIVCVKSQGRTVFKFFLIFFYFCPFPNKTGYIIHVYKSSINITPSQSQQFISGNLSDLKVTRIIQSLYYSPASRCIHPAKVPIEGAVLFKLIWKSFFSDWFSNRVKI